MTALDVAVYVLLGVGVALGALLTARTYRAFRRTGFPELRSLAAGIAVLTVASCCAAVLHHAVGASVDVAFLAQTSLAVVGLGLLTAALYVGPESPPTGRE
jgi:hypothetical protein